MWIQVLGVLDDVKDAFNESPVLTVIVLGSLFTGLVMATTCIARSI